MKLSEIYFPICDNFAHLSCVMNETKHQQFCTKLERICDNFVNAPFSGMIIINHYSTCRKRSPAKGVWQKSDEKVIEASQKVINGEKVIEVLLPTSFCGTLNFQLQNSAPFQRIWNDVVANGTVDAEEDYKNRKVSGGSDFQTCYISSLVIFFSLTEAALPDPTPPTSHPPEPTPPTPRPHPPLTPPPRPHPPTPPNTPKQTRNRPETDPNGSTQTDPKRTGNGPKSSSLGVGRSGGLSGCGGGGGCKGKTHLLADLSLIWINFWKRQFPWRPFPHWLISEEIYPH